MSIAKPGGRNRVFYRVQYLRFGDWSRSGRMGWCPTHSSAVKHGRLAESRTDVKPSELIYDWNRALPAKLVPAGPVQLNDETLRDGLQSPSVRDPSIEEKLEI